MKKKYIVVTGGAGFVGTNLIELLLKKTKYKIISIDNYSSGSKQHHIKKGAIILFAFRGNIEKFRKIPARGHIEINHSFFDFHEVVFFFLWMRGMLLCKVRPCKRKQNFGEVQRCGKA